MQTLKALYESVEKQFFNTLTKKLSSLFLLVVVSAGWRCLFVPTS